MNQICNLSKYISKIDISIINNIYNIEVSNIEICLKRIIIKAFKRNTQLPIIKVMLPRI